MTQDDFKQMWGADPYDSNGYDGTDSGCILLFAVFVAVWAVIGVGIWWVISR